MLFNDNYIDKKYCNVQILEDLIDYKIYTNNRFQLHKEQGNIVRRRKRKGPGGEVSIPTDVHPSVLKKQLIEKLDSGEYTIGEMIVPKKVNIICNHFDPVLNICGIVIDD